jgi:hypothetical protein
MQAAVTQMARNRKCETLTGMMKPRRKAGTGRKTSGRQRTGPIRRNQPMILIAVGACAGLEKKPFEGFAGRLKVLVVL